MKTIYKLEDYTTYIVYARVLHEPGEIQAPLYNLFNIPYHYENDILVPIPENIKYERKETTVDIEIPEVVADKNLLTDKSKLFIHPSCTIPRAKITQKYKRVIKKENIEYAILTVSDKDAQQNAKRLADCGIKGIVNMTNKILSLPKEIRVENLSILNSLQLLL